MNSPIERRALITGASSGIGKATALAFAKAGIHVALISRSRSSLEVVAQAAREVGVEAEAYVLDLAAVEQVREGIQAVSTQFGPIDILVNNAGMGYTNTVLETPLADWQQVINLNLTSVFQCIQGVLPSMREQERGMIINVASVAGQHPFPGWGAYNVSKAALIALSKTTSAEERHRGIRVVTICPGAVNTPLWDTQTVQVDLNRSAMLTPEIVAQSILYMTLVPEQAVIEELTLMPSAGAL